MDCPSWHKDTRKRQTDLQLNTAIKWRKYHSIRTVVLTAVSAMSYCKITIVLAVTFTGQMTDLIISDLV